jgi:hypothetical protein
MREWITYYLNAPSGQLTHLDHLIWSGLVVCVSVIVALLLLSMSWLGAWCIEWARFRRMRRRQKEHPQTFEEWKRGLSRPYDSPTKPNARK